MSMELLYTTNYDGAKCEIASRGGRVTQKFTDHLFEALFDEDVASLKHSSRPDPGKLDSLSQMYVRAWVDAGRTAPVTRTTPSGEKEHPRHLTPARLDKVRERFDPPTTSALMTGSISVGLFVVGGPGALALSDVERQHVVSEVIKGLQTISRIATGYWPPIFVYDFHSDVTLLDAPLPICVTGRETCTGDSYEPCEKIFRDPTLAKYGYPPGQDGLNKYVSDLRSKNETDWAFAAFITKYCLKHFAYAYINTIFINYFNDGHGVDELYSIFAHEAFHCFGAADEYKDEEMPCTCEPSGTLKIQNYNCIDCPTLPIKVACVMDSGAADELCVWSRGQLGWWPSAPAGDPTTIVFANHGMHVLFRGVSNDLVDFSYDNGWTSLSLTAPFPGGSREHPNLPQPFTQGNPASVVFVGDQLHVLYRTAANTISDIYFNRAKNTWIHQDLSNRAEGAVLASGDPVSLNFRDKEMHVFYRDVNNNISDIYYSVSDNNWHYLNLNNEARDDEPRTALSDPAATIFVSDQMHVCYRDSENSVSDLNYDGKIGRWRYQALEKKTNSRVACRGKPCVTQFSGDQMHVMFLGDDERMNDLWYNASDSRWRHIVISIDCRPVPPLSKSDPSVVVFSGDQLHVLYYGADESVADIYYDSNLKSWIYQNLNAIVPEAPHPRGRPSSVTFVGDQMHVVYRDQNNQISDLYYFNGWRYQALPPSVHGNPAAAAFLNNETHVIYRDHNNYLVDLRYDSNKRWTLQDITTSRTGAPLAAGDPFAIVFTGDQLHVIYRDINKNISDVYYNARLNQWIYQNLTTSAAGAPPAKGNPRAVLFAGDQMHVVYHDDKDNISDIYYSSSGNPPNWKYQNLTALAAGAPTAGGNPFPVIDKGDQMHVVYRDSNNNIADVYYSSSAPSRGWIYQNLTDIGSSILAVGDPMSIVFDKQMHVVYRSVNNKIIDMYYYNRFGNWQYRTLSSPGEAPVASNPTLSLYYNRMHVIYRDVNDHICDIYVEKNDEDEWSFIDLTADVSGAALAKGNPFSVLCVEVKDQLKDKPTVGKMHVFYRDADNRVSDLYIMSNNIEWYYQLLPS